jgi:hypothetical protein
MPLGRASFYPYVCCLLITWCSVTWRWMDDYYPPLVGLFCTLQRNALFSLLSVGCNIVGMIMRCWCYKESNKRSRSCKCTSYFPYSLRFLFLNNTESGVCFQSVVAYISINIASYSRRMDSSTVYQQNCEFESPLRMDFLWIFFIVITCSNYHYYANWIMKVPQKDFFCNRYTIGIQSLINRKIN